MVIGPPRSGKSKLIKKLAYDQKRGAVSLCDLLEWNRSEGNEIVKTIEEYLSVKGEELQEI
jgi:adenylate kinase family enzyme